MRNSGSGAIWLFSDLAAGETLGMEKTRELIERFEQGNQFGTCGACSWEYQCPPLLPNDEESQGALDQAFDRHVCAEHPV
jgi:hypothetical protein